MTDTLNAPALPELPRPACTYADHSYPAYTADQMRAYLVEDRKSRQMAACNFCLDQARAARSTTPSPAAPADASFWPVDLSKSRKELGLQIGQMNFRLTALRQENEGLRRRVATQSAELNRTAAPVSPNTASGAQS